MTSTAPSPALRRLATLNGAACTAIGLNHVVNGADGTPGLAGASASEDSQEAFFGAVFAAYGAAWLWAARQDPIPPGLIRFLAGTMALGGVGRLQSMRRRGLPHPFWTALAGVEFAVPALILRAARAED